MGLDVMIALYVVLGPATFLVLLGLLMLIYGRAK